MAAKQNIPSAVPPQPPDGAYTVIHRNSRPDDSDVAEFQTMPESPVRSYARANAELAAAFDRYQLARGQSANTLRAYHEAITEFLGSLGAQSVIEADRAAIRRYQTGLLDRGIHENTLRLRTTALRAFFKFLSAAGLTGGHNVTLALSHRKVPGRVPRVLTIKEVEGLIAAARTPIEEAIVETLYATGVRVSELVNLRFEDVDFANRVIRVKRGKGDKDRIVLFGSKAANALRRYLDGRKPKFLFEVPAGVGTVHKNREKYWVGSYRDKGERRAKVLYLGKVADMPLPEDAMRELKRRLEKEPGYRPGRPHPYTTRGIRVLIGGLAARAGVSHVHPHALRRAFATHLLEGGADLRVIQELMGHVNLTTTMIYTSLSAFKLKEIHDRCHPHAKEDENAEKK
jgi:site-specific recombinase XerD